MPSDASATSATRPGGSVTVIPDAAHPRSLGAAWTSAALFRLANRFRRRACTSEVLQRTRVAGCLLAGRKRALSTGLYGPEIRKRGIGVGEEGAVVLGVLAHERSPVARVHPIVAQPRWKLAERDQLGLRRGRG
jgi:hypothetical protein